MFIKGSTIGTYSELSIKIRDIEHSCRGLQKNNCMDSYMDSCMYNYMDSCKSGWVIVIG